MLSPISLLSAEFSGTIEEFVRKQPLPASSAGGFALLLNRPLSAKGPALPGPDPDGLGTQGGNGLPLDGNALPLLDVALPGAQLPVDLVSEGLPLSGELGISGVEPDSESPGEGISAAVLNWTEAVSWPGTGPIDATQPADGQLSALPASAPVSAAQQSEFSLPPVPPSAPVSESLVPLAAQPLPAALPLPSGARLPAESRLPVVSPLAAGDDSVAVAAQRAEVVAEARATIAANSSPVSPAHQFATAMEAGRVAASVAKPLEGRPGTASAGPTATSAFSLHALGGSQIPMPPAATTLPPPIATSLQDPAWSSALGERVLFMTGHGLQTAEIRLVPHELGPITVKLVVEEGSADLTFTAQHAVTRDAIELAIPRLRDMLSDSGLSLGNATVTDHGMQREGQGHGAGQSPEQAGVAVAAGDIPAIDQSAGSSRQRITQGLIDTFV